MITRPFIAVMCLALSTACTEPPRRSSVADSLGSVDFGVPPGRTFPEQLPSQIGEAAAEPYQGNAEVYGGRERIQVTPAAVRSRDGQGTTLNFEGAEIREVVRVILGDVLGLPYTIDPAVQGQVTLSSTGPLAESDLLGVLESVLGANGATLVDLGGSYQVMPLERAVGRPEVNPIGGRAPRVRPGYGLTIVPLRNISANAAAQFIQPLVGSPEDIRVDPGRNLVLFAGTSIERQAVVDVLADLDVNWLADKSMGIFPLEVTTPEAVVSELQAIFASLDNTGAEPPLVRFVPVARLNAVLAVGTDESQIQEVQRWVERLDRGETVGTQFYVYGLKHAAAEDMARLLNDIFADSGGPPPPVEGGAAPLGASSLSPSQFGEGTGGDTGIQDEGGGDTGTGLLGQAQPGAPGAGESSGPSGPPDGTKIVANRTNNTLIIRAEPETYAKIEQTLQRLDIPPLQVLIEATIAEVTLNDTLRYGVQYYIQARNLRLGFNSSDARTGEFGIEPRSTIPGFNFIFTGGSSNVSIDALAQITDVNVLSSPSVVVQDNSEATLTVGDEVPITTRQSQSVDDADSPVLNSIEYRNTGVILQVRPRINVNGVVSLEIGQEVSRVATTTTTGADTLTPTITQRRITSRVNVQTGQTVVLGGLIQDSQQRGRSRVPVIGEIPVLGSLFGTTNNADQRSELIVFITPRVIRNAEDARDVSEELRSRLRSLQPVGPGELLPREPPPPVPNPTAPPILAPSPPPVVGPRRLSPELSMGRTMAPIPDPAFPDSPSQTTAALPPRRTILPATAPPPRPSPTT